MSKEELAKILKGLLKTETELDFLLGLKKEDLEKLVAVVRGRLEEQNEFELHNEVLGIFCVPCSEP